MLRKCAKAISQMQLLENSSKIGSNASYPASIMKDSGKSVKKLSVLLSSELHLRSKRQALLNDQTLTDLIVSLLTNYLDSVDAAGQEKSPRAAGGK
jgi:hypothetical protein